MNRDRCIVCQSRELTEVMDLGMHPFADRFVPAERASEPDTVYPLVVDRCGDCGFVQARTVTPARERYADYSYLSAHSEAAKRHWDEYATSVVDAAKLAQGSFVVEAGSNDGYLCAAFAKLGMRTFGVDPSAPMNALAAQRGVRTLEGFFNEETASWIAKTDAGADVVVANNVLNHADDILAFVHGAAAILKPAGVFVFQVPSWSAMVREANFNQVYHEHVSYFTVAGAMRLLAHVGMSVVRVDEVDYHGTSLRVFARRGNGLATDGVRRQAEAEGLSDLQSESRGIEALSCKALASHLHRARRRQGPIRVRGRLRERQHVPQLARPRQDRVVRDGRGSNEGRQADAGHAYPDRSGRATRRVRGAARPSHRVELRRADSEKAPRRQPALRHTRPERPMDHRVIHPAFADDRGTIADIFYKSSIDHVGVITSCRGAIRGNHFHKQTTQHVYVTHGSLRYYWQPADKSQPVQWKVVLEGEVATSGPNEIHAMVMREPCTMMVFSEGVRGGQDYESDTFRETIVTQEMADRPE